MPVHILPGPSDPSGTILPQQSFPRAMFGQVASLDTFVCETNPTSIKISTATLDENVRTILIHSGQPLDDMFKYVPTPPSTRLSLAESTLRWRHIAPTAPDTLWCHPYFTGDPFILDETPDLYLIGNQPRFETKMVIDSASALRCRVVLVPSFSQTGQIVLVNIQTLEVKTVKFDIDGLRKEST
jgi:DNA polymerase delta subunit 2